jgi:hypothetical protein
MGKVIPLEMGVLSPRAMRLAIAAYDEVIDALAAVGPVTDRLREDAAFAIIEMALQGQHDATALRDAGLLIVRRARAG